MNFLWLYQIGTSVCTIDCALYSACDAFFQFEKEYVGEWCEAVWLKSGGALYFAQTVQKSLLKMWLDYWEGGIEWEREWGRRECSEKKKRKDVEGLI